MGDEAATHPGEDQKIIPSNVDYGQGIVMRFNREEV